MILNPKGSRNDNGDDFMPRMTGAQFIAETVQGFGITHVFFMPVFSPRTLMEMEKRGIHRIMTHSEKAAAYMADGYARIRRGPGVCLAQSVGALNLAAGLQDAFLAGSPVISMTGRRRQISLYRNAYQEVDHTNPFSAVTKYNVLVSALEQLPLFLRQAFREAVSGTPGPVHLDLENIFGHVVTEAEAELEVVVEKPFTGIPPFRPEPEDEKVREALAAIARARRPVLVAGGGVTLSGARLELVELAEKLSLPVATSLNAKAAIPYDHPLSVGVCGQYSRWCANRVVAEADLVVYVGSRTGSMTTYEWQVPPPGTPVIQIDVEPSELGRTYPTRVAIQADARAALRKLIEAAAPSDRSDWVGRARQLVKDWREEVAPLVNSDASPVRPERLCRELTEYLPADAVLVSDTGHSGIWTGAMIDLKHPEQDYVRCAGSLGWGFPAALGVQCAVPDRPVVCFTGDGGIWYHLAELETALRHGINTVTVINNNHSLNQEKHLNESTYGSQTPGSDALWHLLDVDFARVAEAIGAFGIRVDRPDAIQSALDQAFASGKPAIVDVKTHIDGIAPQAWSP